MKNYLIALVGIVLTTAISCKKYDNIPPSHEPPAETGDAKTVLLKDVVAVSLPSPYFHFVYDNQHYVTQIDFASGFFIYNVEYENKRVKKMTNIRSSAKRYFLYSYSNKQVSEINEFSGPNETKIRSYRFTYNSSNQLTQVLWLEFSTNSNGTLYKKSILTYHEDGNLATIEHYSTSPGQLTLLKKDEFSNYDNKTNVDDFYLLKDFFDAYFFLPQVKLQKNNPLKQNIIGVDTDFDISYTYDYQNNLPVKRTGVMTQTRGNQTGKTIQITNLYNYY